MMATDRLVLDSSLALAWCFADEKDACADAIAARFPGLEAVVPSLWHIEVANALLMGERRGRSTQADTVNWTGFLGSLPIVVDDETTARVWGDTLNLARVQNLSAYDAAYLELALRRAIPLATLDARLRAAATGVGVPLYRVTP
jgi:predicted nucleic acid-binding protein